jgi:hypothetical protein
MTQARNLEFGGRINALSISPHQLFLTVILSVLLLLCPAPSVGQSTLGSITGTVTDQKGGLIPAAEITVIEQNTTATWHKNSANDGTYSVTDLPSGTYTVQVRSTGFGTFERKGIILYASRVVNVDVKLSVGTTTTVVEVSGAPPVIDTETSTLDTVKLGTDLAYTPLAMRVRQGVFSWGVYNPGAQYGANYAMQVGGVRTTQTFDSTNGIVELADVSGLGGGPISPDQDAAAEINYTLVNSPAQFKGPANEQVVVKSGTNEFHGMGLFEYNGSKLNARNFFAAKVPFAVYNGFTFNVGGPIRKNKTFFFVNYDQQHELSQTVINDNTALAAWRTGDFSALAGVVKNPYTGVPFTGNVIPSSMLSQQGQAVLNVLYPLPDYGASNLQVGNWRGLYPTIWRPKTTDVRVDNYFGERDALYVNYTYRYTPIIQSYAYMPPLGMFNMIRNCTTGGITWTHTFAPNLVNQFVVGIARNMLRLYPQLVGSTLLSQMGIPGVPTSGVHGVPYFTITGGGTSLTSTTQSAGNGSVSVETNWPLSDDLSWIRGAHSLRFGFGAIRDYIPGYSYGNIYGSYSFSGIYSGNAVADLLLGLPQTVGYQVPTPERSLQGTMWSWYAQDSWKVTPRLTVNYGIRWELSGPYYDRFGHIASFNPANGDLVVPDNGLAGVNPFYPKAITIETASQAGYPAAALVGFPKRNVYPRLGIAYKLTSDGRTSVRAGYGIYSNTIFSSMALGLTGGPFSGSATLTNSINNGVPAFTLANPFTSGATGVSAALQNVAGVDPNVRMPYLQQWNVTLERQIGSVGLSAGYIGSHATNLFYLRNLDQPQPSTSAFNGYLYPHLSTISWSANGATQNYNSLQLAASKHVSKNLNFQTAFTWQKDLTDQYDMDSFHGQMIQNQYDLTAEYGNNLYEPTKRYTAEAVYSLPVGRDQKFLNKVPKAANGAIGGWRLSTVVTLQSGEWFTPSFSGFDTSHTNSPGGRPDVIPGVSVIPSGGRSLTNWFNMAAFAIPGCPASSPVCSSPANVGRFGNAALNGLEGPPMKGFDLALFKTFHTGERLTWQIECQAQNVLNHPTFNFPSGNISSASGAVITSTLANDLDGGGASRAVHFLVNVYF